MSKHTRYRERQRDYTQRIVMKDLRQFSKIYLIPLSDFHIGTDVAMDVIKGYIDWIKQRDNALTVLNGDLMNCATKESSAELYDDLVIPDESYKVVRSLLLPIKDKIIMMTRGNHEEAIYNKVGCDYMARLAYDLGDIPYKPDGGMFGIGLSRNGHNRVVWGYATHGWGGARTIGAKVKKAQDLALVANVHIYILSHDHTQNINRGNILTPPRSRVSFRRPNYIQIERKLFVNTGGFIVYSGYIQRKGYTPQDLGTPRIRIELKETSKGNAGYYIDLHSSI